MKYSNISSDLIANYLATNYQVGTGAEMFILHINQYSVALSRLLSAYQKNCAAIITAYNPLSKPQSNEKNQIDHAKLGQVLEHYSCPVIESLNKDPSDIWPIEKSFCVLGLNLQVSKSLGQKFNQNAIVWADSSAVLRLILLR